MLVAFDSEKGKVACAKLHEIAIKHGLSVEELLPIMSDINELEKELGFRKE